MQPVDQAHHEDTPLPDRETSVEALDEVERLVEDHRFDEAFAALDRVIAVAGSDVDVALRRVFELAESLGRLSDSVGAARDLARRDGSATWLVRLAQLYSRYRDERGAADILAQALRREPPPFDRVLLAASVFATAGRHAEGLAALHGALAGGELADEHRLFAADQLVTLGDVPEAERQLRLVLAADPAQRTARLHLARLRMWSGDLTAAMSLIDDLLGEANPPAEALLVRAVAGARAGDLAAAERDLDAAVVAAPGLTEAWCWRAEVRLRAGRADDAFSDALRATDSVSSVEPFVAHLLRLLAPLGQESNERLTPFVLEEVAEGIEALCPGAAPILARGDGREFSKLAWNALERLGNNRSTTPTTVAADGSVSRLFLRPSPRWRGSWALATIQTEGIDAARRHLDDVVADSPQSPIALCYRGELDLYLGEFASALGYFRRAIELDPATRWAYIGSFAVEMFTTGPEAALNLWRQAERKCHSPGPTLYGYRGEAYRRLGRLDDAIAELSRSVQTSPTRIGSWINLGLAYAAAADVEGLRGVLDEIKRRAAGFVSDAARECAIPVWGGEVLPPATVRDLLEHMLVMLRGNRSSTYPAYFTHSGDLRFVPRGR